jgi:hypothetical protein
MAVRTRMMVEAPTTAVAAITTLHWTKDKYILCKQSVARRRAKHETIEKIRECFPVYRGHSQAFVIFLA